MSLQGHAPKVWVFLAGWFPEADLEDLDDAGVVSEFLRRHDPPQVQAVISELERLLVSSQYSPQEVGDAANRYFETPKDAELWLRTILRYLKRD
jgi:hypothetical protein